MVPVAELPRPRRSYPPQLREMSLRLGIHVEPASNESDRREEYKHCIVDAPDNQRKGVFISTFCLVLSNENVTEKHVGRVHGSTVDW